jgi:subtilisin family serine protease
MKRWSTLLAVSSALVLASCQDTPTSSQPEPAGGPTPELATLSREQTLPDRWFVVFADQRNDPGDLPDRLVGAGGGRLHYTYRHAFKGFAATLPAAAVEALRRNPLVAYVEADQVMYAVGTQANPTWGLDRIDQRALPLDKSYTYNQTGAGVTAFILDTGIRYDHVEFGGRASFGFDAFGGTGADCHGHGTHVSGTVGGATYGVAKAVALKAVRVLDCNGSGSTTGVAAGVDWVTGQKTANPSAPMVANMSLGGGISTTLETAVKNSIAKGVAYAVAAGNNNMDACLYSPSRVPEAMTIGATTSTDARASYSNWGSCVDWFAPGSSITSAYYTSSTATATMSGTSMASPHTAGVAALYLEYNPGASPLTVRSALYDLTSKGVVTSSNSTNNHLLYSLIGGGSGNNPPVANFSFTTSGLTANFTDLSTDGDGTIVSRSWTFGDGSTSTAQNPSHSYAAAGTYIVSLTVTDDDDATGSVSKEVTVTSGGGDVITLAVTKRISGKNFFADLAWSGATGVNVDVWRDTATTTTKIVTANDGAYSDKLKSAGSYAYKVCNSGTTTCSNTVTVTF